MHDLPESHIQAAEALIDEGEPGRALERLGPPPAQGAAGAGYFKTAGRALNNLGRLEDAVDAFRRAASIAPEDVAIHGSLGHVLARLGDRAAAESAWQRALKLDPDHLRSLRGLAGLYAQTGRLDEAASLYRRVAESPPDDADDWLNLAEVLQFLERPAEAEAALLRAAGLQPARGEIHAALGRLRYATGEIDGAQRAYGRALEANPSDADAAAGRALCLAVTGQREAGLQLLAPFLSSPSPPPAVCFAGGRLMAGFGRDEEAATLLAQATDAEDPHWRRNPRPWYELGGSLERLGRFDDAFDAWSRANRLKPVAFDPRDFASRVEAIIEAYGPAREAGVSPPCDRRPRPLFVVGMPRSGTTLVEQALSCHPGVDAGGERLILEAMASRLWTDHRRVRPVAADEIESLRRQWRDEVGPVAAGASYYTDKFPGNFLHLGLARELLGELCVVWCRRDPADTALSIFANDFNRRIVPWATRLEHIAVVWNAHLRLMRHWRSTAGLPVIEIHYETLVEDFEGELRRLLEALELAWEPACLDFHRSARLANTASYDQVRRPVYATSVGRARKFGRRLEPFLEALEP